jgi:hypothetical protein
MSVSEFQAQQITLVRVVEQARDNGGLWSATDAREATRATAELLGKKAPFDQFLARRADWALDTIGKRSAKPMFDLRPPRWPPVVGWLMVSIAMAIGFFTDHLTTDRRVNLVEYPLVGLIVWNLLIFVGLILRRLSNLLTPRSRGGGRLAKIIGRWRLPAAFSLRDGSAPLWIRQYTKAWDALSARLNQIRLEMVFHTAAMFFALGALASLYVRGFFMEYRAGWESTFFSAASIHAIASVVLAPGALLLNMSIPDVQHVASLQVPGNPGETARDWIHLYAASILVCVIIPRFVLALMCSVASWRQQRSFPLPINNAYFTTLRSIRRGGNAVVLAIPFRYELTPQIRRNLAKLLERLHGLTVDVLIQQPVLMGDNTDEWKAALGSDEHIAVFVTFSLTATAEPDTHGQLMARILRDVDGRTPVIPIVDSGTYADRDADRFRERCNQWRSVFDEIRCKPLFLNLARPDDEDGLQHLEARLNEHA